MISEHEKAARQRDIALALNFGWRGPVVWYDLPPDFNDNTDLSGPYMFPPSVAAAYVAANDRHWDAAVPHFEELARRRRCEEMQS